MDLSLNFKKPDSSPQFVIKTLWGLINTNKHIGKAHMNVGCIHSEATMLILRVHIVVADSCG